MKTMLRTMIVAMLALLAACPLQAQDENKDKDKPERGMIEFGVRNVWGDEYGRPDLPFKPSVFTSKYNEYRDIRNGFFIRRGRLNLDNFLSPDNYLELQTAKSIYKDQSYLATLGRYNRWQVTLRYDEIPHIFSNTARTMYNYSAPGVYTMPFFLRSQLQTLAASTTLPSIMQTQIVTGEQTFVPRLQRRSGEIAARMNLSPNFTVNVSFWREHQSGSRPLGMVFNSSPSASLTGGYGAEIPEPIDYFSNRFKSGFEYGKNDWGIQASLLTSTFENNLPQGVTFDNPFRVTDCFAATQPTLCTSATQGPATGRADLYPSNYAQYFTVAAAFDLGKYLRFLTSINPSWLRQNATFLPYTSNSVLLAQTTALPAKSLGGKKNTLAMNYTLVTQQWKQVQLKAVYRQYDYNNDTPVRNFTPVEGDNAAPTTETNTPFGYNRKTFEGSANWFFARKSSVKAGYRGEWMDRSERDVEHSMENTAFAALDLNPNKDFNFRLSYAHSNRKPDQYVDEEAVATGGGITNDSIFSRRFDEAARLRDRASASASYNLGDRVTVSGFGETTQDDYNQRGGVNSATALNFISGTTNPYYLYGVLKDLSYDWGFDTDVAISPAASFFAEYSHERYFKRMASRYRVPGGASPLPLDCSNSAKGCDSANNDWESKAKDLVDIYSTGFDFYLGKKVFLTTYYSLSAGKGNVLSRPLGDSTITTGANKFLLTGTNAAVDYPETTSRSHEATVVLKYKLTPNLMPKIEYRFQQFDNKDYQTSAMTPYMGCVSALPPSAPVPGCTAPVIGASSPFYPYFVVGDPSAARYLFLGVDQPSYRTHYIAATLEYHF